MEFESKNLTLDQLEEKAVSLRKLIIKITTEAASGHPSSSLSAVEVVTALFFGDFLKYSPSKPLWDDRDRFILSKGHAVPVLYAAMAEAGYFTTDQIMTLRKLGSEFEGHPNMKRLPGIEASTGSLGQGLSIGIGAALGVRMDKRPSQVFVMIGDGEMGEGQVWEAIASAAKYSLGNLTAIIDQNGFQQTGATADVLDLTDFAPKVEPFGWHTQTINGNSMEEVVEALRAASAVTDRPKLIVSRTQKGFGILPVLEEEGDLNYHGKPLPPPIADKALALLDG